MAATSIVPHSARDRSLLLIHGRLHGGMERKSDLDDNLLGQEGDELGEPREEGSSEGQKEQPHTHCCDGKAHLLCERKDVLGSGGSKKRKETGERGRAEEEK